MGQVAGADGVDVTEVLVVSVVGFYSSVASFWLGGDLMIA